MFYLRMISALMVMSLSFAIPGGVYAAGSTNAAGVVNPVAAQPKVAQKESESLTKPDLAKNTTAVDQADADAQESLPMQANIVVWREDAVSAPKNILKYSALNDSLTPTDRDRLAGEVRFGSVFNKSF